MNIIIAGSRTFKDYTLMRQKLDYYFQNISPIIVCGEAKGADELGRRYAESHGLEIISMPADWNKYGKSAGYKRNEQMEKIADGLVAFWDGKSKGTKHMIDTMTAKGKQVRIVLFKG